MRLVPKRIQCWVLDRRIAYHRREACKAALSARLMILCGESILADYMISAGRRSLAQVRALCERKLNCQ